MKLFDSIANMLKKIPLAQRNFGVQHRAAAYDAAAHGARLNLWNTTSASVNSILSNNINELRRRSRDCVRNNPYAANAVEALVSNCIGTGIKPRSKAENVEFKKAIQKLWLQWTDEADAAGNLDFYGLQSLVLRW